MDHLLHISQNKKYLEARFEILKLIRQFFWSENFVEIESPIIVKYPGQEPYLSPMQIDIHDERQNKFLGYLHTSPEYTMKKMLAAGFDKIFYLGKCFRDSESFGGTHNPEFTMIEWYRTNVDYNILMDDTEKLVNFIVESLKTYDLSLSTIKFERFSMKDLWQKYVDVNLDDYLTNEKMFELCQRCGFSPDRDEEYEDLFYRIFLNKIEPNLLEPTIVYNYPAQMAALSKLADTDPRYAERFEVYLGGVELANAFSELTNQEEQLERLKKERNKRQEMKKDVFDIDHDFISSLDKIPRSAGIALGVDRLVMAILGCKNIDNVITLPMSKLFN